MWRVGMNVSQERTEIMTVNETLGNPSKLDVWCNWFSISACHAEGSASHCGFESRHVRKENKRSNVSSVHSPLSWSCSPEIVVVKNGLRCTIWKWFVRWGCTRGRGFESSQSRKYKCVYDGELVYPRHELHE